VPQVECAAQTSGLLGRFFARVEALGPLRLVSSEKAA
jgi:hypothetical protein